MWREELVAGQTPEKPRLLSAREEAPASGAIRRAERTNFFEDNAPQWMS